MSQRIWAKITHHESTRPCLATITNNGVPVDFLFGDWKSKLTLEFDGLIPWWVQDCLKYGDGRVRILP